MQWPSAAVPRGVEHTASTLPTQIPPAALPPSRVHLATPALPLRPTEPGGGLLRRGCDLVREFAPQLANMAVLYLFLGLLNRRSRRLGDKAARQVWAPARQQQEALPCASPLCDARE